MSGAQVGSEEHRTLRNPTIDVNEVAAHLPRRCDGHHKMVDWLRATLSCDGSEFSANYRASEPRRFTQRPRRGFALSAATLVTFAERKEKPRRDAGAKRSFHEDA